LGSLLNSIGPSFEILFLDNGSPEAEADWAKSHIQDSRLRVFKLPSTRFFAGGINFLAKEAQGEFLVLMNSDIRVEPDWLQILDAQLQRTGYEAANADIRDISHPEQPMDKKFCLDPFGLTHFTPMDTQDSGPALMAAGLGMAIKRSVFFEVGAMDDDFKMYFEDLDLSWRVGLWGYRIGYAPGAIIHHVGQGSSTRSFFLWNRFRARRNRIWGYVKNSGPLMLVCFIPVHVFISAVRIAGSLVIGRFKIAVAEGAALPTAFFHIRIPLSKRGAVQKNRKVTDVQLVKLGFIVLPGWPLKKLFDLLFRSQKADS